MVFRLRNTWELKIDYNFSSKSIGFQMFIVLKFIKKALATKKKIKSLKKNIDKFKKN